MVEQKPIYYTLDLEHDYAGPAPFRSHETLSNLSLLDELATIITKNNIRLTVFVTGKTLEEKPESVDFFRKIGAEFELHGYEHTWIDPDFVQEVEKGVRAYQAFFGRKPLGYRSQGGITSEILIDALIKQGIQYDSSLIPSLRLGVYSNLTAPNQPHYLNNSSLLEIPLSVVPKVHLLISASYIRLLGLPAYRLLFRLFGMPSPLIVLFHLVDVIPSTMRRNLPPFLRFAYSIREKKGMQYFDASVRYFASLGYQPEYLSTIYRHRPKELRKPEFIRTQPVAELGE